MPAAPDVTVHWGPKALAALNATEREVDIEGALRAGKTTIGLWQVLNACLEEPGLHCLACRWSDDSALGILRPVWRNICAQAGITPEWHGDEGFDELPNGSRVYVRGLKTQDMTSRYSKFRGLTLGRVYVDQAEEIPRDVYLELAGRLSQPGKRQQMVITPNAVEQDHWIAEEFPADNSKPGRLYIPLSVRDNAHNLDPSVIPALERLYPQAHPKHRTLVMGLRGMNVIGDPVYAGAFNRQLHEHAIAWRADAGELQEAIDFGKHHPCVVYRQVTAWGEILYLGGLLGQDMFLEDFLPLVLQYRSQWFPGAAVRTCCDPAGASDTSHGMRQNAVKILQDHGFRPVWKGDSNSPDVRLAMVERIAGHMRKRAGSGREVLQVDNERWLRISTDACVTDRFLADGWEAGYVWDAHMVSVGSKQMRKPKKDGWYEHGQNCAEYLEYNFGSSVPVKKGKPEPVAVRRVSGSGMDWAV